MIPPPFEPDLLLQLYLSMDGFRASELEARHRAVFGDTAIIDNSKSAFRRQLESLSSDPGHFSFIAEWAQLIAGAIAVGVPIQADVRTRVAQELHKRFYVPNQGFVAVARPYLESHEQQLDPEVYATFYGLFVAAALGDIPDVAQLTAVRAWLAAQEHDRGYYNRAVSATAEEYRKQGELAFQSLCALKAFRLLDHLKVPGAVPSDRIAQHFRGQLISFAALSPRYHAALYLLLRDPSTFCGSEARELAEYVASRQMPSGGCVDYYVKEKRDEASLHTPRFQRDQEIAHLYATFYALHLAQRLHVVCGLPASLDRELIRTYLKGLRPDEAGFYGETIYIKEYRDPFGTSGTLKETLLLVASVYFF